MDRLLGKTKIKPRMLTVCHSLHLRKYIILGKKKKCNSKKIISSNDMIYGCILYVYMVKNTQFYQI